MEIYESAAASWREREVGRATLLVNSRFLVSWKASSWQFMLAVTLCPFAGGGA